MIIKICEICGKRIESLRYGLVPEEERRKWLNDHRIGRFTVSYEQAVADENGDVQHMTYADNFCMCPECEEVANQAVWKAFEPIIKNRNKKRSISVSAPKFPREPVIEGCACCPRPFD